METKAFKEGVDVFQYLKEGDKQQILDVHMNRVS